MGAYSILTAAMLLAGGAGDYDFDGKTASAVPSEPDALVLRDGSVVSAATGTFQLGVTDHVTRQDLTYGDKARFSASVTVGSDLIGIELVSAGFPPAAALPKGKAAAEQKQGGPAAELPAAPDTGAEGGVMLDRDVFSDTNLGPRGVRRAHAAVVVEGLAKISRNGKVLSDHAPIQIFALSSGVLDDTAHAQRGSAAEGDTELHIRSPALPLGPGGGDRELVFENVVIALGDHRVPSRALVPEPAEGAKVAEAGGQGGDVEAGPGRGTGGAGMAGVAGPVAAPEPGAEATAGMTGAAAAPTPVGASGIAAAPTAGISAGDAANLNSIFPAPSIYNPPAIPVFGGGGPGVNAVYPGTIAVNGASAVGGVGSTTGTTTATGVPTTTTAASVNATTGATTGQAAISAAGTNYNLGPTYATPGLPGTPSPINSVAGSSLLQGPTPLNAQPATTLPGTPTPVNSNAAVTPATAGGVTATGTSTATTTGAPTVTTTGSTTQTVPTIPGTAGVPGVVPVLPTSTNALPGTSPTFPAAAPSIPGAGPGTIPGPAPATTPATTRTTTTPAMTPAPTPAAAPTTTPAVTR